MHARLTSDLARLHADAHAFLAAGEPVTSLIAGLIESNLARSQSGPRSDPPPQTASVAAGPAGPGGDRRPVGGVVRNGAAGDAPAPVCGVLFQSGPFPALLSPMPPAAAAALARAAADAALDLVGIQADAVAGPAFAEAWRQATGAGFAVDLRLQLHALRTLRAPVHAAPGSARRLVRADQAWLGAWLIAFARDAHMPAEGADRWADALYKDDRVRVWEVDGEPVSMAAITGRTARTARIGAVYTPRRFRGHGFASHVTHALSAELRTAGVPHILLFTDAANPTSNGIYRSLGYEPFHEELRIMFDRGSVVSL